MSAKQDNKKSRKAEILLSPQEGNELEIILDRLTVQNPNGESLRGYLQSLRKALLGRQNLVAALLDKLARDPSAVGFEAFATLQDIVRQKDLRRLVKQAAYRFSQKGYAADRDASPQAKVVLIPREARQALAHMVTAPDVDWFVACCFPGEAGGEALAVSAYTENRFQHLTVRVVETSQKLYRDFLQKLAGNLPASAPFEVPAWHAAGVFFDMLRFNQERGKAVAGDLEQAKELFRPFHHGNRPAYAHQLFKVVEEPAERIAEVDGERLFASMPGAVLLFPKADVAPYFHKLQELERSVLVVRREIQQERAADLLRKAADELCAGRTRFLYQRLFEEQALALKQRKMPELAEQAWIVAQQLASPAGASENPVLIQIIMMSMQSYWPNDFADTQQSAPLQQGQSGLILPR